MEKIYLERIDYSDDLDLTGLNELSKIDYSEIENINLSNLKIEYYSQNDIYIILEQTDKGLKQKFYIKGKDKFNEFKLFLKEKHGIEVSKKLEQEQVIIHTGQELGTSKKEVSSNIDLPSQNIETLENLYDDKDFPKQIILDLIKEKLSKTPFKEKIKFLERNKDKDLDLFYYGLVEIIKSVKGEKQAKEILKIVGKDKIQRAVKEYIIINDKFAEDYWFYYNSDRFSVECKENIKIETCKSVGAYIWALGGGKKGLVDMQSIAYILFEAFGDNINTFANTIESGIKKYQDVKGRVPDMGILKKEGLIGLVRNTLSKTNMSTSQKDFWTGIVQLGAVVGVIWGLIKIIKKNGFKGILGLIVGEFVLEAGTGKTSLELIDKLLYDGIDLDIFTKKGLEKGKESNEYAKLIGHPSLINALVGEIKLTDLKKYGKFENGKLVAFDAKKFADSLPENDWRKALLEKIGYKKAGEIFVLGLSQMGLNFETSFNQDKKFGEFYKKYLEDLENRGSQSETDSNNSLNNTHRTNISTSSGSQSLPTNLNTNQANTYNQDSIKDSNSDGVLTIEITGGLENVRNIINFFDLSEEEFYSLSEKLEKFNFDLLEFLETYKRYIEANLSGFKYNGLIKKLILVNLLKLDSIIQERIDFVDKQVQEGDIKPEDRENEIKNQRWIIAHHLNDKFNFINNVILPNSLLLHKFPKSIDENTRKNIESMFESEITEDGKLDRTFSNSSWYEIYDILTDSWDVPDFTDEKTRKKYYAVSAQLSNIEGTSILSKEDKKIERDVIYTYYGLLALQIGAEFTPIGWTAGAGIDAYDTFSDEEALLKIAQTMPWVDKNYRMEKTILDNILSGLGLIPGMTILTKGDKLYSFFRKLGPEDKSYFFQLLDKIGEYLGISKEKIIFLKSKLQYSEEKIHVDNKGNEISYILDNSGNIVSARYKATGEKLSDQDMFKLKRVEDSSLKRKQEKMLPEESLKTPFKLKIKQTDFETPYKFTVNGKYVEIGYDKGSKKYFVREGDSITSYTNGEFKAYLRGKKEIKVELEKQILLRRFQKAYKNEKLYREKISGTEYLKGKEIKLSDKKYVIVKKEGTDEYYVLEKNGNTYKLLEKKTVDEFIEEHPEFVSEYLKTVGGIHFNNSFIKRPESKYGKLAYDWTVGEVINLYKNGKVTLEKLVIEHPKKSWQELKQGYESSFKQLGESLWKTPSVLIDIPWVAIENIFKFGIDEIFTGLKFILSRNPEAKDLEVLKSFSLTSGTVFLIEVLQQYVQDPSETSWAKVGDAFANSLEEIKNDPVSFIYTYLLLEHLRALGLIGDIGIKFYKDKLDENISTN